MAPTYRYFTADLLTGNVLGELPLYGVYMDKQLSQAGQFTGTFRIGTGIEDDVELINASIPQKTAIYVQRDGTLIWGGIIWSRTFESNAKTVQLSAQTFESYPKRVVIQNNFIRTNMNQLQIAKELFDSMQSLNRANIGIDTTALDTTGGILKNLAIASYDYKFYSEALDQLANADDGFDYTIVVEDTAVIDHPNKRLILGQPTIRSNDQSSISVYDYPGSINQFYWPESGSNGGTDFIVLGRGSGSNMLNVYAAWPGSESYPIVNQIVSFKNIGDLNSLASIAQDVASTYGPVSTIPTFSLTPDRDPAFISWNDLGSLFQIELESPRFTTRKIFLSRMIGWELNVASSEQGENLKLRIEGGDSGG